MTHRSTVRLAILLSLGAPIIGACTEYPTINPWDPRTDVTVSVTGPDTLHALGDIAQFGYSLTPALDPAIATPVAEWTAPGLQNLGDGRFRVVYSGVYSATVTVVAFAREASRTVVINTNSSPNSSVARR